MALNIRTNFVNTDTSFFSFQRCLLLVNFDVDAICACRILQQLFKNDHMIYTLVPVRGIQDMISAFDENCEEVVMQGSFRYIHYYMLH